MRNKTTIKFENTKTGQAVGSCTLCISCIICGESVRLTEEEQLRLSYGLNIQSKVCDKCKRAVLYIRTKSDKEE